MSTAASSIIDRALELTNRKDTTMRGRALGALRAALAHWAERRPWEALRTHETFLADGTRYLTFPDRVRTLVNIIDITNKSDVSAGGRWGAKYPDWLAANQTNATPYEWRPLEAVPVVAPPSTDTALQIEASISESMTVTIRGLSRDTAASGTALELYPVIERYVVAGTGSSITAAVFVQVHSIEKSLRDGFADLVVSEQASGKRLARIAAEDRAPRYQRIEWLAVPPAGTQMRVEYFRRPEPIVSENSTLPPGADEEYLAWRVAGDLHWIANEGQAATTAWTKADSIMAEAQLAEQTHGERFTQIIPYINSSGLGYGESLDEA